jgi:hypothetical protein
MTKPSSSNACGSSCANSAGPPTPEEIARIIRALQAAGAKVLNTKGEPITPADLAELVKEGLL